MLERTLGDGEQARTLALEYRPVIEDEHLARILLLATDITAAKSTEDALEKARAQRDAEVRELQSVFTTEPSILNHLLDVARETVREVEAARIREDFTDPSGRLFRDVHTLKGNAGTLDFDDLANAAGALEDALTGARANADSEARETWRHLIAELERAIDRLQGLMHKFDKGSARSLTVDRDRFAAVVGLLHAEGIDGPTAALRLEALDAVDFGRFCQHYERLVAAQSLRLKKTLPEFEVLGADEWIPRSLTPVFETCLVHLIRNAIAHGIEDDEVRETHGKPPRGKIEVAVAFDAENHQIRLSVSDDGSGIDGEHLARKALESRLLTAATVETMSDQNKVELVFLAGLSSRDSADELSGRGVGMDAVKHAVEKQGGNIEVRSRSGEGAEFVVRLPLRKPDLTRVDG